MPPRRLLDPIWVLHDGERLPAERGEPLALALLAAGKRTLARSPKLHRPRGPSCLSGSCDGCLCRVNGEPNVMTCLTPAQDGDRIETQNSLGSRTLDPLQLTDYVFPQGFDHHRLFAGVPLLGAAFPKGARQLSGIGELTAPLPEQGSVPSHRAHEVHRPDVLIVGAGEAGARAALELRRRAPELALMWVDRALSAGGRLALSQPSAWSALQGALGAVGITTDAGAAALDAGKIHARKAHADATAVQRPPTALELASTVIGLYPNPEDRLPGVAGVPIALLARRALNGAPSGASVVAPRAIVLAVGHHPPVHLFGNNDLPGVYTARAALLARRAGVLVGQRLALVGGGEELEALIEAGGFAVAARLSLSELQSAVGALEVRGVSFQRGEALETVGCDAVVVGGQGAPAFELAMQAGLAVRYDEERGAFVVEGAQGEDGSGAPRGAAEQRLEGDLDEARGAAEQRLESDCVDDRMTDVSTNPQNPNPKSPMAREGRREASAPRGSRAEHSVLVAHRETAVSVTDCVLRCLAQS
ncbi:MAG: (2Fe-2S)-binding protein [Polyangiaceae bacterium]|nr:(2Fe-2S)-binding protein [Polyangiaceae bacterium]MCW5792637.1 (2Fe-2S)-binding protein [Polyangiaceae bacterium]